MAMTLDECRAVAGAARASGRNYMMVDTTVSREFLYVQEQLRSGMIGRIQFLRGAHLQEMSGWPGYWEGLLPMHYATHAISPLLALAGCAGRVRGLLRSCRASSSPTPMFTSCSRRSPGRPRCGRTPCVWNASRSFRAGRRRAGGPRVPQPVLRAARTRSAVHRPGTRARAVRCRAPIPGRRRPVAAGVEDDLTRAAIRLADRICEDFDPDGRSGSDGHPEVEVGLMELYRATGHVRYRDQVQWFIDQRGHRTFEHHAIGYEYYLDDVPLREATVLRGHVVRAMYLTAAAVDLAVKTGDGELLGALVTQWENTWARRTYLTGGMGSRHLGESFGRDFELPPDRAYAETCGAVGAIMVAWRLLLATGESHFAGAIARLLYNMIATSPNVEGDRFFYVNPLLAASPGSRPLRARRRSTRTRCAPRGSGLPAAPRTWCGCCLP
jgi:hypothetical protein